ncbi:unnamed protein product [Lactuca virosa]|uniref:Uncharacterized protein n=1 Tax=Lactuca virosa TaxID=75947 RepID=A0AAU9NRV9_9ASTR|nr:unnamed protein product [Lactuca virosa]
MQPSSQLCQALNRGDLPTALKIQFFVAPKKGKKLGHRRRRQWDKSCKFLFILESCLLAEIMLSSQQDYVS